MPAGFDLGKYFSIPPRKEFPKIWWGCDLASWKRILVRSGSAIDRAFLPKVALISAVSAINTLIRYLQEAQYGYEVERAEIVHQPIFIIGHWRTGTTLLHELLILDPRHAYPTTYQCMSPNHFLLSESRLTRLFSFLLPGHRPMDKMRLDWQSPQEDEFAMCNMGQPSPYLMFGFPDQMRLFQDYLCLDSLSPKTIESWKESFHRFLKQLTLKYEKRIILKSPPHTFRIRTLLELFPNALFVHIVRNPYIVFPSTVHMFKSLCRIQCLQNCEFEGLEDFVFDIFDLMQKKIEGESALIDPSRFFELRYEDLIADPVKMISGIYDHFGLGEFETLLPLLRDYQEKNS
jgi:omega-hydroxy-beta-dihydromenaquinone-9 sulfotransferase